MPADAAWYAALPLDPASATKAYIARIPAETRARANALAESAHVGLALRIVVLVASKLLAIGTGLALRMRAILLRVSARPWLQDATFAGAGGRSRPLRTERIPGAVRTRRVHVARCRCAARRA